MDQVKSQRKRQSVENLGEHKITEISRRTIDKYRKSKMSIVELKILDSLIKMHAKTREELKKAYVEYTEQDSIKEKLDLGSILN